MASLTTRENALVLENTEQALPHLARLLAGVDTPPDTGLLVVVDHRGGLGVVGTQTLLEGIGVVVRALDQRLASHIVLHVALGRVEDLVIRAAGGRVDQTASDASHQERVVDLQLNGALELLLTGEKHVVQTLGLGNSAGETIQNESTSRLLVSFLVRIIGRMPRWRYIPVLALSVVVQLALDHVDHDLVADQTSLVHDLLGLLS